MSGIDPNDPRLPEVVRAYMAGCRRDGDCLVRDIKGYGEVWIDWKRMGAHRAVYLVKNGAIPSGHVIRHKCDRPQCVEPAHLETGTTAQNSRDSYDRQRRTVEGKRGESNPGAILTDALVAQLRREARSGIALRPLAAAHGLNYTAVYMAVRGRSWRHVEEAPVTKMRRSPGPSPRRTPPEVVAQAERMVREGHSLSEVGAALGLDRVTVHRVLSRSDAA